MSSLREFLTLPALPPARPLPARRVRGSLPDDSEPRALDDDPARAVALQRLCGRRIVERLWRPLLDSKFDGRFDDLPATYMWARTGGCRDARQGRPRDHGLARGRLPDADRRARARSPRARRRDPRRARRSTDRPARRDARPASSSTGGCAPSTPCSARLRRRSHGGCSRAELAAASRPEATAATSASSASCCGRLAASARTTRSTSPIGACR